MQFLILETKFWFPEMVHMKHTLQDKIFSKFWDLFEFGDQAPILYFFPNYNCKTVQKTLADVWGCKGCECRGAGAALASWESHGREFQPVPPAPPSSKDLSPKSA